LWPIAPDLRPTARVAEQLAYTQGQEGRPDRLHALDAMQRKALRAADSGIWPMADTRPAIAAGHSANMDWQVGQTFFDRGPIPDRDPATSPLLLDLAARYNRSPEGVQVPFYSTRPQLRPYPVGVQRIGGIDFDLRGVMDVARAGDIDANLQGGERCIDTPDTHAAAVHALLQSVIRQPTDTVTTVAELA
jgi:hypothetical protein